MPAELAEDSIELEIDLLEAGEPTFASYPYPSLKRLTRREGRTFRAIMLENPHFRATMVPELGGRIISIADKKNGIEVLPPSANLDFVDGGKRGVDCNSGLQILTEFGARLNAMGPVADMPDLGEEDEGQAAVWLGEIDGKGISLNWRIGVPDEEAWIEIEVRAFNRTLSPIAYNGGISIGTGEWRRFGANWVWKGDAGSLLVETTDLTFAESGELHRFDRLRELAPRQLDSWSIRVRPIPIGANLQAATQFAAAGWDEREMAVALLEPNLGKIVVRTLKGSVLEMPVDGSSNEFVRVATDSFDSQIAELVVLDRNRNEVLRAPQESSASAERRPDEHPFNWIGTETPERELGDAQFDVRQRYLFHVLSAHRHVDSARFTDGARSFEEALLFNAEDHLAWWGKAAAERNSGQTPEERPELLNAHFLAPMEPLLRAESFLSSPNQGGDKTAMLAPLGKTPVAFVEVACQLIEAGFLQDAAIWLGESLRHIKLPMLHYLLAYAYTESKGLDVEAAEQVQLAARSQPEAPFPWRPVELVALKAVAARFPSDESLRMLLEMAEGFGALRQA